MTARERKREHANVCLVAEKREECGDGAPARVLESRRCVDPAEAAHRPRRCEGDGAAHDAGDGVTRELEPQRAAGIAARKARAARHHLHDYEIIALRGPRIRRKSVDGAEERRPVRAGKCTDRGLCRGALRATPRRCAQTDNVVPAGCK